VKENTTVPQHKIPTGKSLLCRSISLKASIFIISLNIAQQLRLFNFCQTYGKQFAFGSPKLSAFSATVADYNAEPRSVGD
jgi:hypothetical protein